MARQNKKINDSLLGLAIITLAFVFILIVSPLGTELYNLAISETEPETCPPAYILPNGLPSDYNCTASLNYTYFYTFANLSWDVVEFYNQTTGEISIIQGVYFETTEQLVVNVLAGHMTNQQWLIYSYLKVNWDY